jgi:DNA-binding PadR family transcriptional regulator
MGLIAYTDVRILELAAYGGDVTKKEAIKDMNKPRSTILMAMARLRDKGFLEMIGHHYKARYLITNSGWKYLQKIKK